MSACPCICALGAQTSVRTAVRASVTYDTSQRPITEGGRGNVPAVGRPGASHHHTNTHREDHPPIQDQSSFASVSAPPYQCACCFYLSLFSLFCFWCFLRSWTQSVAHDKTHTRLIRQHDPFCVWQECSADDGVVDSDGGGRHHRHDDDDDDYHDNGSLHTIDNAIIVSYDSISIAVVDAITAVGGFYSACPTIEWDVCSVHNVIVFQLLR